MLVSTIVDWLVVIGCCFVGGLCGALLFAKEFVLCGQHDLSSREPIMGCFGTLLEPYALLTSVVSFFCLSSDSDRALRVDMLDRGSEWPSTSLQTHK